MHYIVTTRNLNGIYRLIIETCRKKTEYILKKNINIILFKKKFSFSFFLFFLFNLLTLKVFNDHYFVRLKYKKFDIGRHAYATALRNNNAYLSFIWKNYFKIKFFYEAGLTIEAAIKLSNKSEAIYVDHGVYLNGLIIQVFSEKKKIIFQNVYPRGLSVKNFKKQREKKLKTYEEILVLRKKEVKLNNRIENKAKKELKKIIFKPENIPWIKGVKFKKNKNLNFKKFTHIVYAHSFADGQLVWGYDGFCDMREWLIFTLKILDNNKNKILVKAHPNFTIRGYFNEACKLDRMVFLKIKNQFRNSKNIYFETNPTKNVDLLKKINKKTIIISHHGSAILECSYFKLKSISSESTFWENKLHISNSWKNKQEYVQLLNLKWENLNHTNYNHLYIVSYLLYCNEFGHYGKKFWHQIISDETNISRKYLDKNINKIINKIVNFDQLTNTLSKNIQIL